MKTKVQYNSEIRSLIRRIKDLMHYQEVALIKVRSRREEISRLQKKLDERIRNLKKLK